MGKIYSFKSEEKNIVQPETKLVKVTNWLLATAPDKGGEINADSQ